MRDFFRDNGDILGFSSAATVVVVGLFVLMYRAAQHEERELAATCAAYVADSRTHSDSLNARMSCDNLRASKAARDAATAAMVMSAAAAGSAASSASYRGK